MAITVLTQASSGAQRCSGTQGDLTTLLDWALNGRHGWTIAYTASNERVYQSQSGYLLYVNDNSATSGDARIALVRGCESASSVSSHTDEFPTVAQVGNTACNWQKSTSASTTARNYRIIVGVDFFWFIPKSDGTSFEPWFFGRCAPRFSADTWSVGIMVRNTTNNGTFGYSIFGAQAGTPAQTGPSTNSRFFFMRDVSGTIKSTRANIAYPGSGIGAMASGVSALGGYLNGIMREQSALCCIASSSTTLGALSLYRRAWLPQMWSPLHIDAGGLNDADTFGDSEWDAGASFRVLQCGSGYWCVVEETDTWAKP